MLGSCYEVDISIYNNIDVYVMGTPAQTQRLTGQLLVLFPKNGSLGSSSRYRKALPISID